MTNENEQPIESTPQAPSAPETPQAAAPPVAAPTPPPVNGPRAGYTVSHRAVLTVGTIIAGVALFGGGFALGSWRDGGHRHHGYNRGHMMTQSRNFGGRFGPDQQRRFFGPRQQGPGNQGNQQAPNRQQTPNRQRGVTPQTSPTPSATP